jgi:hypothetical protein
MREFYIRPTKRGKSKVDLSVYNELLQDDNNERTTTSPSTPLRNMASSLRAAFKPKSSTATQALPITLSTLPIKKESETIFAKFPLLPDELKILIITQAFYTWRETKKAISVHFSTRFQASGTWDRRTSPPLLAVNNFFLAETTRIYTPLPAIPITCPFPTGTPPSLSSTTRFDPSTTILDLDLRTSGPLLLCAFQLSAQLRHSVRFLHLRLPEDIYYKRRCGWAPCIDWQKDPELFGTLYLMANKLMPKLEICFLTRGGRAEVEYGWVNVPEVGRIEHWEWLKEVEGWRREGIWRFDMQVCERIGDID